MRIEYENKFSDLITFNAIHQFLSPTLQGLYVTFFAFVFWSESSENTIAYSLTTAFSWYLGLWIFQFLFNVVWLFSRKNGAILTKHIIEVQPEALLEETKFNKSFFYWPGIVKAVSRPGFVAIYVTPHIAHVIPSRAFPTKAEQASFLALVKEKIRAAAA